MDKTSLMARLMVTFREELTEHVRAWNRDLLSLEKGLEGKEHDEHVQTLFRTVHSLKGAARAVNVSMIETACHRLEEILTAVRDGRQALDAPLFQLLFAAADAIEEAGMRLREEHDLADAPLASLLPRLAAAAEAALEMPSPSPVTVPASASRATLPAPLIAPEPTGAAPPDAREIFEPSSPTGSVRVAAEKLDTLLARIGELLVVRRRLDSRREELSQLQDHVDQWKAQWQRHQAKSKRLRDSPASRMLENGREHLRRLEKNLAGFSAALAADSRAVDQVAGPLDDEVRRVRMLPFAQACEGLERMGRDLARAAGKEVEIRIEGGAVEMDRSVLEELKDPLRHLVRNGVDHGLEPPDQRRAAGKPARGRITVAAALRGAQVEVTVRDDGRGLDMDALREQARRRGLADSADPEDLARLIFLPSVSTAPIITDVSGRGVGLDVVKSRVEALHGTVHLDFQAGKGTSFTLTVPLTLTTLRAVLVKAGELTYAFAGTNVHRLLRVSKTDVRSVSGRAALTVGGPPLPLAFLSAVLNPRMTGRDWPDGKVPVAIIEAGERRLALAVDDFVAEQEILIKSLGPRLRRLPLISGATLLASGRIALVLNAANLIRAAVHQPAARTPHPAAGKTAVARKRLLVVEDSATTRTLMKSILETAGYEIAAAVDGQAGWRLLGEQPFDLVVSDVEMPHTDGFALTEMIRANARLRDLPVVLVTARETDADKARGIAVGANAYLLKSAFDQSSLLQAISQLL